MAFNLELFATVTASSNKNANTFYAYSTTTNTITEVKASGFFDDIALRLVVGDIIAAKGSSGNPELLVVTAVSPAVTTAVLAVPALSILTSMIANLAVDATKIDTGAVTLAKLASGVTPSHVPKFGGKHSGAGGSATVTITVAGMTTSHLAFAQIQSSANAVTVQKVTPSVDTITVLCSADPGACVITYQALLAAA